MTDLLVSGGYKAAGYEYVIIDDCWLAETRAADGQLQPNPVQFPSGMKALADYVSESGITTELTYQVIILHYYNNTLNLGRGHAGSQVEPRSCPWWRHQMETFSALLTLCAGNSPVTDEFPTQRPVTRSFDVFFDLRLNKRLTKQSRGWWFETPSHSLWRHCNAFWCWCFLLTPFWHSNRISIS